jgi:hypothetical protein
MNTKLNLKENVLSWLNNQAGMSLLGPFEFEENNNEDEGKTTFIIYLSGTPGEFIDGHKELSISPSNINNESKFSIKTINDGRKLDLTFEVIDEYFIGAYSHLNINIEKKDYSNACILANYANTRTNLAFFQIINNTDTHLAIKVRSFSSVHKGASSEDFHNILYSVLVNSYRYWILFSSLSNTNLSASDIILNFENDDPNQ